MNILDDLGIYTDTIENMVNTAEQFVEEATGGGSAINDLHDGAYENLQDILDARNITNSIIVAYFSEAERLFADEMDKIGIGIEMSWEANCDASYITLTDPSASSTVFYSEHELVDLVHNKLVNELDWAFSDIAIDEEAIEKLNKAVKDGIIDSWDGWVDTKVETIPRLLESICENVSEAMIDVLNTGVEWELDWDTLAPTFTIYKDGGNIDKVIEGEDSFVGTFTSDAFRQVLENAEKQKQKVTQAERD